MDLAEIQIENGGNNPSKMHLKVILEKYFENVPEELPENSKELELVTKNEYGKNTIKVGEIWSEELSNEELFNADELTIGTDAKNTDKYGWKVKKYTVKTEEYTTGVWRLFYQDSKYAYLIANESVGNYTINEDYYDTYKNASMISKIGKKLNPTIKSVLTESNESKGAKSIAWLTDPTVWASYCNEDAVFALACPTIDLLVASYNSRSDKTDTVRLSECTVYGIQLLNSNGFAANLSDSNHGIYCNGQDWYLATSAALASDRLNCVYANGSIYDIIVSMNTKPVRPIVCIPSFIFDYKYASSMVDE